MLAGLVRPTRATYKSFWAAHSEQPTPADILEAFGAWSSAVEAAGLGKPPGPGTRWGAAEVERSLRHAKRDLGPYLTRPGYSEWAKTNDEAPLSAVVRVFSGSWEAAAASVGARAGIRPAAERPLEELLAEGREVCELGGGGPLSCRGYNQARDRQRHMEGRMLAGAVAKRLSRDRLPWEEFMQQLGHVPAWVRGENGKLRKVSRGDAEQLPLLAA